MCVYVCRRKDREQLKLCLARPGQNSEKLMIGQGVLLKVPLISGEWNGQRWVVINSGENSGEGYNSPTVRVYVCAQDIYCLCVCMCVRKKQVIKLMSLYYGLQSTLVNKHFDYCKLGLSSVSFNQNLTNFEH